MADTKLDLKKLKLVAQKSKEYTDKVKENLGKDIDKTNASVTKLQTSLETEIKDRKTSDDDLTNKLKDEISRAKDVETYLETSIQQETARAREKEIINENAISNISSLIPSNAKSTNQLLDRETATNLFGNSLGTYRANDDGLPFSGSTLEEAVNALKLKWTKYNTVQNDYAFIQYTTTDEEGRSRLLTWRYAYIYNESLLTNVWTQQFELTMAQAITDAQYDAMNSGITKTTWEKANEDIEENKTSITNEISRATEKEEVIELKLDTEISNRKSLAGHTISISQEKDHVIDIDLLNADGESISHQEINLDSEHIIDKVDLDYTNKKLIFTFKDGHSLDCDISALIDTLISKINLKVDKTTTIAGVDLEDSITAQELRSGLGLGTIYDKNIETVTDIKDGTNSNIPDVKQVKDYVNTYGGKIDKIQVNGTDQTIIDKIVNITVPTKISDLDSDGLGKGNLTINVTKNGETTSTVFNANSSEDKSVSITSTVVKKSDNNGYVNVDGNEIQIYSETDLKDLVYELTDNLSETKQDNLTAGNNITISNNVISASIGEKELEELNSKITALDTKVNSWVAMETSEIDDIMK